MGSILATIVGVRQTTSLVKQLDKIWDLRKNLLVFGGGFGFLLILTFFVKFTYLFAYLIGFLLASLAALAMILAARVLHEKTPNMQEPKIYQAFLADTSYAVYLFPLDLFYIKVS